jgi:hypothetical protein
MKLYATAVALALLFGASEAEASLTSSEKAQVRDFVGSARVENASRVRSLVARTDLTTDESIAALVESVSPVAFTAERGLFLRELVFGGSSAASRPLLAQGAVRALLARADALYQKYAGGLDHEPRALAELVAIYAFLDGTIANAGHPTSAAHDASAGIPAATYEECAKELAAHVERNARWLKGDGALAEGAGRVRAQAQVALFDMLPDGLTRRVDAADRLGLKGARRQMLTEWGILLADAGKLDDAKAERVRQILTRLPGARLDLALVYAGEDHGALRARGLVAFAGGTVVGADQPFGDELTPASIDATTSVVVHDLAVFAVKHALDNRGELRLQAERDAAAAKGDAGRMLGKPHAPSVEHVVGSAAHLLLVDAPRAVDLAFVRMVGGRPESAALLSDAIGALAAFAVAPVAAGAPAPAGAPSTPPPAGGTKSAPAGLHLELGRGSSPATATMGAIRLAPNGAALGFTLDGHVWSLERSGPTFAVTRVTRDGQPLSLAHLATARTPMRDGSSWTEGALTFSRLRGSPRAGIAPSADKSAGPTVKLIGVGGTTGGFDAIATAAPGDDFVMEGELLVRGAPGGVAFRAANGREAVRGAMLVVTPGGRLALLTSDDTGTEAPLADPIEPTPAMPLHVKITVKGTKVSAVVGQTTLAGTLPATLGRGEVGLVAKRGAIVELAGFTLKKK